MKQQIKVLLIEDDINEVQSIQRVLSRSVSPAIEIITVETFTAGIDYLKMRDVDLILLDLSSSEDAGNKVFTALQSVTLRIPLIALIAPEDDEMGLKAVRQGAQDYVLRTEIEQGRLVRAILIATARKTPVKQKSGEIVEQDERHLVESIGDTITDLTTMLNQTNIMNLILENIRDVVPHDAANIMLLDGDIARITHHRGYTPEVAEVMANRDFSLDIPHLKHILKSGKPHLVPSITVDPDWVKLDSNEWIKSYVGVPIFGQGEVIGFLNLDSRTENFFNEKHLESLQMFADQAAIAVQNAHMYKVLNEYANEVTTLYRTTSFLFTTLSASRDISDVGQEIVNTVVKAFDARFECCLLLVSSTANHLIPLASTGETTLDKNTSFDLADANIITEAVNKRQMMYKPDNTSANGSYKVQWTGSELAIPLIAGKSVIGVLKLWCKEVNAFSDRDRRILEAYAVRAATTLENVQLYERIRQYADDLEARVKDRTAEVLHAKERVEAILNSSSDAVVLASAEGQIRQTNPAFDELFGYDVDELFGGHLKKLIAPESIPEFTEVLEKVIQQQRSQRIQLVAHRKDNTIFDTDVALSVIPEGNGGTGGIVCSLRDITEHKQIEESLRISLEKERELNDLKSRFISMTSHEFRTPLATILSSGDILKNYWERMDTSSIKRHVDNIHEQVHRMTGLLEDILMIGRAEAGRLNFNPEEIDPVIFFEEELGELRRGVIAHHVLEMGVSGDCGIVVLDKKLLRHILGNLLTNATKYSSPGSTVSVKLHCDPENIHLEVADQGIGIPEKDRERIFESFHRAENVGTIPGTGLGLSILKQAVELHGGSISFESKLGIGTTFTVVLPGKRQEDQQDDNHSRD